MTPCLSGFLWGLCVGAGVGIEVGYLLSHSARDVEKLEQAEREWRAGKRG